MRPRLTKLLLDGGELGVHGRQDAGDGAEVSSAIGDATGGHRCRAWDGRSYRESSEGDSRNQ